MELISAKDVQKVIEDFASNPKETILELVLAVDILIGTIVSLPIIESRPTGKWIRITQGAMPERYMCPFCKRTISSYSSEEILSITYPYCHCGADMRCEE